MEKSQFGSDVVPVPSLSKGSGNAERWAGSARGARASLDISQLPLLANLRP